MQRRTRQDERGSAFILVLILTFILAGAVGLLLVASATQSRNSMESEQHTNRLLLSDNGLAKAKSLLLNDPDAFKTDLAGTDLAPFVVNASATADGVLRIDGDGAQVWVLSTADTILAPSSGPWVYQVTSIATTNGSRRTTRMILEIQRDPATVAGAGLGAVVAQGTVDLSGNIGINGNDHDRAGGLLASGPGDRPGVVTDSAVTMSSGSASVGGSGVPMPSNGKAAGSTDENTSIWDSEVDPTDGSDDDGDGIVDDNYGGSFPGISSNPSVDPDQGAAAFLDWPNGSVTEQELADAAASTGTLFDSYADYDTWRTNTPNAEDRGGLIIYIRYNDPADPINPGPALNHQVATPFELPNNLATSPTDESVRPSMLVVGRKPHPGTGVISHDLIIKNLHGDFQGLIVFDQLDKVNSGTNIVGSVVAYKAGATHLFGNGTATLKFSSDVLSRLPSADPSAGLTISNVLAWWEE